MLCPGHNPTVSWTQPPCVLDTTPLCPGHIEQLFLCPGHRVKLSQSANSEDNVNCSHSS